MLRLLKWLMAGVILLVALGFAALVAAQTEQLGKIDFPTSGSRQAQPYFIRGVLLLHSFEYEDAREAFQQAEKIDPSFALAYWGEAMTYNHTLWKWQDREAARAALHRLAPTAEARQAKAPTEREKGYLHAVEVLFGKGDKRSRDLAYAEAMRRLHERYPEDLEAAAFYALAILGTTNGTRDFRIYMRAAAVAEEVFAKNPLHPGAAHYLIHAYDDPIHAPLGLRAARAYSKIAPDAAHAQHMTSHIFLALGMWDDVVRANETAVAVVNRKRRARGQPPSACGHYNFWLEYGYLQQGRFEQAKRLLAGCRAQAAAQGTPDSASRTLDPDNSLIGSYVQMRTRYLLDTEDWSGEVRDWSVPLGDGPVQHFSYEFASGMAAVERGDLPAARTALQEITAAASEFGPVFEREGVASGDWERKVPEIDVEQLRALILAGEGREEEALAQLRMAAAEEDTLPYPFGPPAVDKPSDELMGELLLKLNRPVEARAAFETALDRAPRRALSLLGLARSTELSADADAAREAYAELRSIWHDADDGLPALKEVNQKIAELGPTATPAAQTDH